MKIFVSKTFIILIFFISILIKNIYADNYNNIFTLYLDSEYKIKKGEITKTSEIPKVLKNFSLYPYLELTLIKKNLNLENRNKIQKFYSVYGDSPVTKALNYYWINYLYHQNKWDLILQDYKSNNSIHLKCIYTYALQKEEPNKINKELVESLWIYPKSRPKACNPLFDEWLDKKNTIIDEELIQKRIIKAFENRNIELGKYLNKKLSNRQLKKDNDLYIRVHNRPNLIKNNNLFNTKSKYHKLIILNGIKRIYYKNPIKALKLLKKLNTKYKFNRYDYNELINLIAIRLYQKKDKLAEVLYNKIPNKKRTDNLIDASIKYSISNSHWKQVILKIENTPKIIRSKDIWQYWLAKAYEKNNNILDSKLIMAKLSKKNNYYGLLAKDFLQIHPKLEQYSLSKYKAKISKLENNKNFQRALDFYKLKRMYLARKEWNYAIRNIDKNDLIFAAMIAKKNGWHDRAIITLTVIGKQRGYVVNNANSVLYPTANEKIVNYEAKNNALNPSLIYAVAKKESLFMNTAGSNKGAQGLMQIMPATAKGIAKKLNDKFSIKKLNDPKTNIKYGAFYLREMLNQYNDNIILAAAAYNAGPTNVKRWLAKYNNMPADMWIEMIPYKETRNYTKSIVSYTVMYDLLFNNEFTISEFIKNINHN